MTIELKDNERLDDLQRNNYRIIQNPERFCFGMDAVLLSGFTKARKGDHVLDLGTGTGIIPILLSAKTDAEHLTGLEIQEESADMARRSVLLNNLQDKIDIVTGDLKEAGRIFKPASFEVVTCNPPYMAKEQGMVGANEPKTIARHEVLCTLEDVIAASTWTLKPGGKLYMVHRPSRLGEIITVMKSYHMELKRLRIVYPYVDKEPAMVLLEASRGGKSGMFIEKPLIIYRKSGVYTDEMIQDYGF